MNYTKAPNHIVKKLTENLYRFSYITFRVGNEEYSAKSNRVTSVISLNDTTIRNGYTFDTKINLTGEQLYSKVIDLHSTLKLDARDNANDSSRMIIVDIDEVKVGFVVDQVIDFFYIDENDSKPLDLQSVTTIGDAVIRNVIFNDMPIRIIDFEQILHEKQNPLRFIVQ